MPQGSATGSSGPPPSIHKKRFRKQGGALWISPRFPAFSPKCIPPARGRFLAFAVSMLGASRAFTMPFRPAFPLTATRSRRWGMLPGGLLCVLFLFMPYGGWIPALIIAFVIALSTPVLAALKEPDFGLFPALTLGLTFGIAFAYPAIIISEVLKHNAERKTDAAQADPAGFPDEPSGRTSPIRKPPPHTDAAPPGFRHPSCRSSLSPGRAHKPFPFFSHDALFPGATGKRHRAERLERCGNIFPHEPGRRENGVTEPKPAAFFPGRRETRAKEKVDAEPNPTPTHTKVFGGEPFWRKALPLHVSTIPPPSTRPPVRPPDAPAPQGRGKAPASRSCARAGGRRFAGPATPPAPGLRRRRDKGSP